MLLCKIHRHLESLSYIAGTLRRVEGIEIDIDHIVKVVCEYFDIEMDTFNSSKRTRDVAQARQVAMYLAKQHTKAPLTVIGSSIGGRNHATVLHSCKAVADMIDTDKQFKAQMEEIERLVLSK